MLEDIGKRSKYARKYEKIESATETNWRADDKELIVHPPPFQKNPMHVIFLVIFVYNYSKFIKKNSFQSST